MKRELWQVTRPHLIAGFVVENGIVKTAAPIIRQIKGMKVEKALAYLCNVKGTKVEKVL